MTRQHVKPVPDGMHTVTPHLVCKNAADAIEFYTKAFGLVEMARLPGPQGKLVHAMIRIGDSAVMLVDEFPDWGSLGPNALNGSPVTIHLYVEDVDATVERAVAAGAKIHRAGRRHVLGRSLRQGRGPFRAPLVDRHAYPRRQSGGNTGRGG
jgi:PhnB protein